MRNGNYWFCKDCEFRIEDRRDSDGTFNYHCLLGNGNYISTACLMCNKEIIRRKLFREHNIWIMKMFREYEKLEKRSKLIREEER